MSPYGIPRLSPADLESHPRAGGQPAPCHAGRPSISTAPRSTIFRCNWAKRFDLPPAVPTRFPLKREPAHVPGTASGFRVHVLKICASVVAVVAVAVAVLLVVAGRGAAGGTHPRPGVGRHLVWHLHGRSGAAQRQQHTRGRISRQCVCGLQIESASRTHAIRARARHHQRAGRGDWRLAAS